MESIEPLRAEMRKAAVAGGTTTAGGGEGIPGLSRPGVPLIRAPVRQIEKPQQALDPPSRHAYNRDGSYSPDAGSP